MAVQCAVCGLKIRSGRILEEHVWDWDLETPDRNNPDVRRCWCGLAITHSWMLDHWDREGGILAHFLVFQLGLIDV